MMSKVVLILVGASLGYAATQILNEAFKSQPT